MVTDCRGMGDQFLHPLLAEIHSGILQDVAIRIDIVFHAFLGDSGMESLCKISDPSECSGMIRYLFLLPHKDTSSQNPDEFSGGRNNSCCLATSGRIPDQESNAPICINRERSGTLSPVRISRISDTCGWVHEVNNWNH